MSVNDDTIMHFFPGTVCRSFPIYIGLTQKLHGINKRFSFNLFIHVVVFFRYHACFHQQRSEQIRYDKRITLEQSAFNLKLYLRFQICVLCRRNVFFLCCCKVLIFLRKLNQLLTCTSPVYKGLLAKMQLQAKKTLSCVISK